MSAKYSIVVPCFNEEETIPAFYEAIILVMDKTKEKYEVIFVNDGSKDATAEILKNIASKDKRVKVINFDGSLLGEIWHKVTPTTRLMDLKITHS